MECTIRLAGGRRHGLRGRDRQRPSADDGRRAGRRRPQPGAAADGNGAGRHRRLHGLRRGADPEARPPRCAGLPGQGQCRARRPAIRRCSPGSTCTSSSAARTCRPRLSSAPSRSRTRSTARPPSCSARRRRSRPASKLRRRREPSLDAVRGASSSPWRPRASAHRTRCRAARGAGRSRPRPHGGLRRPSSARRWRARPCRLRGKRSRWPARCCFDLALGLDHETQAHGIAGAAGRAGRCANAPAYHSGLSRLRPSAEFVEALLRPGEVIGLLARGVVELSPQCGVARGQGLGAGRAPGRRPRRRD